jgi:hypothetical protein
MQTNFFYTSFRAVTELEVESELSRVADCIMSCTLQIMSHVKTVQHAAFPIVFIKFALEKDSRLVGVWLFEQTMLQPIKMHY